MNKLYVMEELIASVPWAKSDHLRKTLNFALLITWMFIFCLFYLGGGGW